jgi:hypothetical protein
MHPDLDRPDTTSLRNHQRVYSRSRVGWARNVHERAGGRDTAFLDIFQVPPVRSDSLAVAIDPAEAG